MITEETVLKALETVNDPEIGIDVVNLGFIYNVKIEEGDKVTVAMTLTMKGCPLHASLKSNAEDAIRRLAGAREAEVNIVWDPPWNPKMMSDKAKGKLGFSSDMLEE
jgi:metal-sulfur cluster biosynthetic enzyme